MFGFLAYKSAVQKHEHCLTSLGTYHYHWGSQNGHCSQINFVASHLREGLAPRVAVDGDEVVGPVLGGDDAGDVEQPLPGPVAEGVLGGGVSGAFAAGHGGGGGGTLLRNVGCIMAGLGRYF